jgi:HEAT repeat protein
MRFAWWLLTLPFRTAYMVVSPRERKVSAGILRVEALTDNHDVIGLIHMLDSDLQGRSVVSLRQTRSVRGHAVGALQQLGDPRAIPHLIEMRNDPEESVRQDVILALGHLHAPDAEPFLLEALEDPSPGVRGCAAASLGHVGAIQAIPLLWTLLDSDPDPGVQFSALEALVILGDPPSLDRVDRVLAALPNATRRLEPVTRVRDAVESGQPLTPWRAPRDGKPAD